MWIAIVAFVVCLVFFSVTRNHPAFKSLHYSEEEKGAMHTLSKRYRISLFLFFLLLLFAFLPLEKYLPYGEILKYISAGIAVVLGLVNRRKFIKAAEASGHNNLAQRYRKPSPFVMVQLVILFIVIVLAGVVFWVCR